MDGEQRCRLLARPKDFFFPSIVQCSCGRAAETLGGARLEKSQIHRKVESGTGAGLDYFQALGDEEIVHPAHALYALWKLESLTARVTLGKSLRASDEFHSGERGYMEIARA